MRKSSLKGEITSIYYWTGKSDHFINELLEACSNVGLQSFTPLRLLPNIKDPTALQPKNLADNKSGTEYLVNLAIHQETFL